MRRLLASTATFIFGVVPASALVVFALVLGVAPIYGLFQPDTSFWRVVIALLVAVPVSALGILGYMGLFEAVAGSITAKIARWLLAGVVANLVGIAIVVVQFEGSPRTILYLFVPPLVVGGAHLGRFHLGSRKHSGSA